MNKFLAAAVTAALAVASTASIADTIKGDFFINAGVGQARHRVGYSLAKEAGFRVDTRDTAGALRFGYVWYNKVDFGVEGGYANLGKIVLNYNDANVSSHSDFESKGWLLGVNAKYRFAGNWYTSTRGGWMRSTEDVTYRFKSPYTSESGKVSDHGNGWYGGVGVGYDFTPNFSLGVNYDNYHVKYGSGDNSSHNVAVFTGSAEYRF